MLLTRRAFCELVTASGVAGAIHETSAAASAQLRPRGPVGSAWDPWIEVDRASLLANLRQIETRTRKPVMAVIKANGYGHGLVGTARALAAAGVKHFLVGKLDEARELRVARVEGMILNFGPFREADAEDIIRLGISQNIYDDRVEILARAAERRSRRAHVHVKVDTGLGRVGVHHEKALEFIAGIASRPALVLDGVFTTFTEDPEFDAVQLARFREICARAAERGIRIGLRHAASSDAICNFPAAYEQLDMVRPGIMLYGLYPSTRAEQERKLELKPALSLKARVALVKTLQAGESVSYHRAFTATQPERVATLPVGYSDGYPRALAGKGHVLIAGRRCPIVAISANATIVRLGEAPAVPGDEAVLLGTQNPEQITASEIARLTESSVYAVVMGMSAHVPRVFV